jgi:anti-anti-sigma factor
MKAAAEDRSGDSIQLGADGRSVVMRACGHIRANDCSSLREEVFPEIDSDLPDREFFVDLSGCTYMDSTFIGLLVAMDKRIGRARGKRLRLLNPAPECVESLKRLGLDRILSMENGAAPISFPASMRVMAKSEKPGAEFILKTHEALMETTEEAKKKFGLVMELLAKKLRGE